MKDDIQKLEDKWEFNSEVTHSFDDMLKRSIPQYDLMRESVFNIASHVMKDNSRILDIGTSRGEAIARIVETFPENKYYCIEQSKPMLEVAAERFKDNKNVSVLNSDLKEGIPGAYCFDIILSILTIQFIPIEYRQFIIQSIYNKLLPGGVFVYVEKILGQTATIDKMMVDIYLNMKKDNGYSDRQIIEKKLSLEGVLVPVTAKWNEELLKMAGFRSVDCFWRWMNFSGWIAYK